MADAVNDAEPIVLRPAGEAQQRSPAMERQASPAPSSATQGSSNRPVCFNRQELNAILLVYGRRVAAGEWRDYALDMQKDRAVFSIFRRTSEMPIYRVEKNPKLARKQGAFSVIAATGAILKRGPDLRRVLQVLEKRHLRVVD